MLKVIEVLTWCINNSSNRFLCLFDYSSINNTVFITVYLGDTSSNPYFFNVNEDTDIVQLLLKLNKLKDKRERR